MNRSMLKQGLVFSLLVVLGVVGRLYQPDWNFTPTAAVGMFAAFYFSRLTVAALVPLLAMAISNIWLPSYGHAGMMGVVFIALAVPLAFGRRLQRAPGVGGILTGSLVSSILFYLSTNLAHWVFLKHYPPTLDGLIQCYTQAIPFFRGTLSGDIAYACAIFGLYAIATTPIRLPSLTRRVAWQSAR